MTRVAIIGDVHGHADELIEMLGDIEAHGVDQIVLLGDLLDRGPESIRCLRIARTWKFTSRNGTERPFDIVLGNHEDAYWRAWRRLPKPGYAGRPVRPEHPRVYSGLTIQDLRWIERQARWLYLPDLEVLCVHGGVLPEWQTADDLDDRCLRVRYLDVDGQPLRSIQTSDRFWAEEYDGRMGIAVFGHESHQTVTEYEFAIAVDGEGFGRLHAVILSDESDDPCVTPLTVPYHRSHLVA